MIPELLEDAKDVDARDTANEPRKGKPRYRGRPDSKRSGSRIGKATEVGDVADGCQGVRLTHITLRAGEPSTWGRG